MYVTTAFFFLWTQSFWWVAFAVILKRQELTHPRHQVAQSFKICTVIRRSSVSSLLYVTFLARRILGWQPVQCICPHQSQCLPSLWHDGCRVFRGVKQPERGVGYTTPFLCQGCKWVGLIPLPPLCLHRHVMRWHCLYLDFWKSYAHLLNGNICI
jgi:hypothetical protein